MKQQNVFNHNKISKQLKKLKAMYQILETGDEYEIFSIVIVEELYDKITKEIIGAMKENESIKQPMLGAIGFNDVPTKDRGKINVWISYIAEKLPVGFFDVTIHECIIYDDIPDIILDKYNEFKKSNLIYERATDTGEEN
jgi:hypothetical protein